LAPKKLDSMSINPTNNNQKTKTTEEEQHFTLIEKMNSSMLKYLQQPLKDGDYLSDSNLRGKCQT